MARRRGLTAYGFLAPGLLLFAAFRVYPLLDGLRLSFTNARLGRPAQAFVGLANYERLLEDTRFHVSLWNTLFYTVASTLPILAIPLLLAVALNRGSMRTVLRGGNVFDGSGSAPTAGDVVIDDARITKVFYPVFPPDRNAGDVLAWLEQNRQT